jgi:hypothetical protein
VAPGPVDNPDIMRNRGLVAACGAAIVVMLLADVAAAAVVARRDQVHTPRQLKGVLPTLTAFVEANRGLRFKRRVDIVLLDDQRFDAALTQGGGSTADPAQAYLESRFLVGFLKAMGLVGSDFALSSFQATGTRSLLGLYDPATQHIVVRSQLPEPLLRRVVVHELTHALDNQYHSLNDVILDLRTEQGRALQALMEGDARRIDILYRDQLPPADRAAADGDVEGSSGLPASVGPFLKLLAFPYVAGPDFVRALVAGGGTGAIDDAFRSLPTTSEEILHPDRFLQRAAPVLVAEPGPDGPLVGLGVLGELGLRLVLGETLDAAAAARAADGWGADHYVAWSNNERICVRVNLRMDSPTDTAEVRDALRQWAAKHPGADVRMVGDMTTVTRCA